jgi:hypothetical protein
MKICGVNRETTTYTLAQCQDRRREDVLSVAIACMQHSTEVARSADVMRKAAATVFSVRLLQHRHRHG